MTPTGWDAEAYDRSFGFVSGLGRGLIQLLEPLPGERIIDLGCGTGDLAVELGAAGAHVIGLDADEAMIERASCVHPGIEFRQADGHDFHVDAPVDAVFSNAALHWMLRPAAVIARVHAALRPGGRFVGEFGGQGNIATIRQAIEEATAAAGVPSGELPELWFFPSSAEYATLLEAGGFRVRSLEHFDRPTPLEEGPDGLEDWIRMFGQGFLAPLTPEQRDEVVRETVRRCRPHLYRDGRWFADYVRLRFLATRRDAPRRHPRQIDPAGGQE